MINYIVKVLSYFLILSAFVAVGRSESYLHVLTDFPGALFSLALAIAITFGSKSGRKSEGKL